MKIGRGVSELWRVKNLPLPLTWPMAYTTACTTVQAVISIHTTMCAQKLNNCKTNIEINMYGECSPTAGLLFSTICSINFFKMLCKFIFKISFCSIITVLAGYSVLCSFTVFILSSLQ